MMRRILHFLPVIACMALSAFFVYFPLTDSDIFWHLAAGREMAAHKHFLFTDPFSFTCNSPRWIDVHWLFQLLVYGIYVLGAEKALVLFKVFVVAAAAGLLCATAPRAKRTSAATCMFIPFVIYVVRYLIDVRPVLITIVCMVLFVLIFERTRTENSKRMLFWCIPLEILWANSQGLYMLGLFIIGAYWVEAVIHWFTHRQERQVILSVVLVSSIAACFVTPYGIAGLLLPFTLLGRIMPSLLNVYSMNIAENIPLFSLAGYETIYIWFVVISSLITCILFIVNRRNLRIAHIVLFAGFLWLSISAVRNVLLYAVILIPILLTMLHTVSLPLLRKTTIKCCMYSAAGIVLCAAFVQHSVIVSLYPPNAMVSPFRFPDHAVTYIKQHPLEGRLFNDIRSGGYLLWNMYPQKQVFIDGRLVIRSPQFFMDYLAVCSHPELYFTNIADKYSITRVLLPFAIFPMYHTLISWLYHSDAWQLEYTDGVYVVFCRSAGNRNTIGIVENNPKADIFRETFHYEWSNSSKAIQKEAQRYYLELVHFLDKK